MVVYTVWTSQEGSNVNGPKSWSALLSSKNMHRPMLETESAVFLPDVNTWHVWC